MVFGRWLQQRKRNRWAVDKLHHSIQGQALRPDFYYEGGARDNFSGRFEMTSLHAVLLFRRLREAGATGKELAQEVTNALFDGFDEVRPKVDVDSRGRFRDSDSIPGLPGPRFAERPVCRRSASPRWTG